MQIPAKLGCVAADTQAVTFLKRVKEVIEDPRRLLLSV
jgi:pyruvate/2-oxoglutarate dehydrogenase complex dihydrolipoamide acyltransferase (E2) component